MKVARALSQPFGLRHDLLVSLRLTNRLITIAACGAPPFHPVASFREVASNTTAVGCDGHRRMIFLLPLSTSSQAIVVGEFYRT